MDATLGYFRDPSLRGDLVVFVAEGDLWRVPITGGHATRLTTHPGPESSPEISRDGKWVAYGATYEGSREVWVLPIEGGVPERLTWTGAGASPVGWTADGRVICVTQATSQLPAPRLLTIGLDGVAEPLPLDQAATASVGDDGRIWFTRFPFQGSHTRRYQGGTAQDVWSWQPGDPEARRMTDWVGTDRDPIATGGRVYFLSDREGGTTNVWSMAPDGSDPRPLTSARDLEVRDLAADGARVVYRQGADLHLLEAGRDTIVPIRLDSDFDQAAETWVDEPWDWVGAAHLSPDGSKVVVTARGQASVFPVGQGRRVDLAAPGARWRDVQFRTPTSLVTRSDESGEVELWTVPANGVGERAQLTHGATVLRSNHLPNPLGTRIAHVDKDLVLRVLDVGTREDRIVETSAAEEPSDLTWSPDGRWLAWTAVAVNGLSVVRLYDAVEHTVLDATTDRQWSSSPSFSHDGDWLFLHSDRNFERESGNPWSAIEGEPYFGSPTLVLAVALRPGIRSPFAAATELHPPEPPVEPEDEKERRRRRRQEPSGGTVVIAEGLRERLEALPIPAGRYRGLQAGIDRIFMLRRGTDVWDLVSVAIDPKEHDVRTVAEDVDGYELSADRKRLLVYLHDGLSVIDATGGGDDVAAGRLDLSGWRFRVDPRQEWAQMFHEAWRLERDYFYQRDMHGVDWPAMLARYEPLLARVSDRAELSDLVSQMVGELSALHTYVYGGDHRYGDDYVVPAELGGDFTRVPEGFRLDRIWPSDPDQPWLRSPLAQLGDEVRPGEIVTAVDGASVLGSATLAEHLRGKAGRQVLLHLRTPADPDARPKRTAVATERDAVVVPLDPDEAWDRRYHAWELERRRIVEEKSAGRIGYVHLRAMGGDDIGDWFREYLPITRREGLVVDVRGNGGGNIDSWILERLLRKVWASWNQRAGQNTSTNMQFAFRGHLVVLCDQDTASDGEAFAEGFRRLGLGKVIGTRTWGGEIWLTSSNFLVDGGIATAAEFGMFGPEGEWLIEGRGVEPDIVVDNLPVATFRGGDAQLDAAIAHLLERIAAEPIPPLVPPAPPDKSR